MGVDTCIAGGTGQVLTFAERNVLTVRVLVAFGQTKINDEHAILVGVVTAY